jgi:Ca2+-binding EF-hand superfamily protein
MFFQIEDKRFVFNTKNPKQEIKDILNENLKKIQGNIQIKDFKTWYKI